MEQRQEQDVSPRAALDPHRDNGVVGMVTVGHGARARRVRGQAIQRHACAGWVVDIARRVDHACARTATHQAADGQWYCHGHDPADLPRALQRLIRDGKLEEARLVALRRGVPWDDVTAERVPVAGPLLTGAQIEALVIAVRDHLSRLDTIPFRPEERGRHRRKLQGALAQLGSGAVGTR